MMFGNVVLVGVVKILFIAIKVYEIGGEKE